ncbi:coiled-coil domain-containing protein 81-like [Harpia harpyja]|uniref:coiled-coil domain-containing protein 81-like n=1 Tax=Harpia harpyja TaxID=202280 RepID=UPI0022B14D5F|nr:coiled-coil domain-containing protein 81-like [Harpia harpyja]
MHTVNSEVLIVQRPMFHMSKVVADECNLSYAEEDAPADVTVVPLRCEELSVCAQLPFTTVQCCVYETVTSFFRATSKRQDTDFVFKSIGFLSIRNREVTMRFFDDFLLTVDGTGKLLEALLSVS